MIPPSQAWLVSAELELYIWSKMEGECVCLITFKLPQMGRHTGGVLLLKQHCRLVNQTGKWLFMWMQAKCTIKYTKNKMWTWLRLTPPALCGLLCGGSCPQRRSAHGTAPTPAGPAWGSLPRSQTEDGSAPHACGSEWNSSLIHPHPAPPEGNQSQADGFSPLGLESVPKNTFFF